MQTSLAVAPLKCRVQIDESTSDSGPDPAPLAALERLKWLSYSSHGVPSYDLLALTMSDEYASRSLTFSGCFIAMTAMYVLKQQTHCSMHSIFLDGLFLMVFDRASIKDGSAPSLAGRSSSIPTNLSSHILWATFIGTGGEAAPTTMASAGGAALLRSEAKESCGGVAGAAVVVVVELREGPGKCCQLMLLLAVNSGTPLSALPTGSPPTRGIDVRGVTNDVLIAPLSLVNPPPNVDDVLAAGPGRAALETAS